jgi:hypothetical protein
MGIRDWQHPVSFLHYNTKEVSMQKRITRVLLVLSIPTLLSAQSSDLGNWLIYFGNLQVNEKWNWHSEVQYRNYDTIGDMEQLLLRTGIGYNLSENNNNFLVGYGFIESQNYVDNDNKNSILEHRIYQQFISKQRFDRVFIQHRYRFEQRWVEEDFRLRFRYFLLLNVPLNQMDMSPGAIYASAYNELFINNESPIFDRNRIYGGMGYRINERFRVELGYMNQIFEKDSRDQLNMIVFVSF